MSVSRFVRDSTSDEGTCLSQCRVCPSSFQSEFSWVVVCRVASTLKKGYE